MMLYQKNNIKNKKDHVKTAEQFTAKVYKIKRYTEKVHSIIKTNSLLKHCYGKELYLQERKCRNT